MICEAASQAGTLAGSSKKDGAAPSQAAVNLDTQNEGNAKNADPEDDDWSTSATKKGNKKGSGGKSKGQASSAPATAKKGGKKDEGKGKGSQQSLLGFEAFDGEEILSKAKPVRP